MSVVSAESDMELDFAARKNSAREEGRRRSKEMKTLTLLYHQVITVFKDARKGKHPTYLTQLPTQ